MLWELTGEFLGEGSANELGISLPDYAVVILNTNLPTNGNLPQYPSCAEQIVPQRVTGASVEPQPTEKDSLLLGGLFGQSHLFHLGSSSLSGPLNLRDAFDPAAWSGSLVKARFIEVDYVPTFSTMHFDIRTSPSGPHVEEFQRDVSYVSFTILYENTGNPDYVRLTSPPTFAMPEPFDAFNFLPAYQGSLFSDQGSVKGLEYITQETLPLCGTLPILEPDEQHCVGDQFESCRFAHEPIFFQGLSTGRSIAGKFGGQDYSGLGIFKQVRRLIPGPCSGFKGEWSVTANSDQDQCCPFPQNTQVNTGLDLINPNLPSLSSYLGVPVPPLPISVGYISDLSGIDPFPADQVIRMAPKSIRAFN